MILSSCQLRYFEHLPVSELERSISALRTASSTLKAGSSSEIFGQKPSGVLGDAPAWVDAGVVYEELIATIESRGLLDFVFCVDPWAAQLRSRAGEIAGEARWVLVSDLEGRKREGGREAYWESLAQWFGTLSYAAILQEGFLDEAKEESEAAPARRPQDQIFLQQLGSWLWRRVSPRPLAPVLFLVRYSGSLAHLRIFLDSLARQTDAGRLCRCVVLSGGGEDVRSYLRWFAIAQKGLPVDLIEMAASSERDWRAELGRLLAGSGSPALVLLGDHSILPGSFVRTLEEDRISCARGTTLGSEASAHIITGNLDPIANYESLLRAHSGVQEGGAEGARILSPEVWQDPGGDSVSRILALSQTPPRPAGVPIPILLQLRDQP